MDRPSSRKSTSGGGLMSFFGISSSMSFFGISSSMPSRKRSSSMPSRKKSSMPSRKRSSSMASRKRSTMPSRKRSMPICERSTSPKRQRMENETGSRNGRRLSTTTPKNTRGEDWRCYGKRDNSEEWVLCSDDDSEDDGMGMDIESNNEPNHETQDTVLPFVNGISTFGESNGNDFDDADLECKCDSTQLSNDHIRKMLHDTSDIVRKQIHPASWEGEEAEHQSAEKRRVEKQTTPSLTTSFLADEADRKGAYLHPCLRQLWTDSYWRALGNPCPFKRHDVTDDDVDSKAEDTEQQSIDRPSSIDLMSWLDKKLVPNCNFAQG